MNDQPPSMLEAQKIVVSWPSMPSASSEEDAGSIDLLDALSPLLEQAPAELRAALLRGDPHARGAMAALRKLVPDILSGVIDALRERAGAGDCQGTLERIPVLEALGRAAGNDSALGEAEYLRGYAFRRLGQKYRAIDAYQKALAHGGDIAFRSRTLDRLGNLQTEVGAFDDAEASYETALGIETDPGGQAAILRNIANAERCLGDFSAADYADRQAAILCGTSAKEGYALDAAAQSFSEIGDHPWALELNSRAKSWFEKNSPVGLPVNAEIRVALLHKAGRPQEAEAQFRLALGLFDAQARATIDAAHYVEGWRQGVVVRVPPYSPLMLAYALATKTCAVPAVQQVITNAQRAGDIGLALRARALKGGLLFDAGKLAEAAAEFEDVLSEASARGLAIPEIGALITLASISQSGGELTRHPLQTLCRARQLRDLMAAHLTTLGLDPLQYEMELNDLGVIENQLGQYASELEVWSCAADFFEAAAERSAALNDRAKLTNRLAGLRRAASRAGQVERAKKAAARLSSLLEAEGLPDRAQLIAARALEAHNRDIDPTAARRWIEVAAQAAERIRAATPPTDRESVGLQWSDLYWTLAQARREQGKTAEAFDAIQLGKFRALAESIAVRAGVSETSQRLSIIQSCLRDGEALLDVALERAGVALYIVRRAGIEAVAVPGDPAQLLQPDTGDVRERAAALLGLARENVMLADVAAKTEALLSSGARLFIAPDPRLGNLPWHAIPVGDRVWCEARQIIVLPAASALLASRRERVKRALVMGDARGDLPAARAECATVASLYSVEPRVGSDCSAAALRNVLAAGPLDVLHIATHGRGNPRQGGLASLLLADQSGQPQWTDLAEIVGVPWEVGLVVLSGCSTGLLGRRNRTQFVSLAESVLRAGARSVVACLWPVGDEAARLAMEAFHRRFAHAPSPDVGSSLDAARAALQSPAAVVGAARDGRGLLPTGATGLERALNWSAYVSLGLPDPFT